MRVMTINIDNCETAIALSELTLLSGYSSIWYEIVNSIKSYFNNKNSDISLSLDFENINKKDWDCLFLSVKDALSFEDKITLKSPIYSKIFELLKNSIELPEYLELQIVWENLCQILMSNFNEQMSILDMDLCLEHSELSLAVLAGLFKIKSLKSMTLFEQRMTLLKWFLSENQNKQRLIIFEYPEIYANKEQMDYLMEFVKSYYNNATYFIFISNYEFNCNCQRNVIINDTVINEYYFNLIYNNIADKLPFVLCEKEFGIATENFLNSWHRSEFSEKINLLSIKNQYIIIYLCKMLNANINIDKIISDEIKKFYYSI